MVHAEIAIGRSPSAPVETVATDNKVSSVEEYVHEALDVPELSLTASQAIQGSDAAVVGRAMLYQYTGEGSFVVHRIAEYGQPPPTPDVVRGEARDEHLILKRQIFDGLGQEGKQQVREAYGNPAAADHALAHRLKEVLREEFHNHIFYANSTRGVSLHQTPASWDMSHHDTVQSPALHALLTQGIPMSEGVVSYRNEAESIAVAAWKKLREVEDEHRLVRENREAEAKKVSDPFNPQRKIDTTPRKTNAEVVGPTFTQQTEELATESLRVLQELEDDHAIARKNRGTATVPVERGDYVDVFVAEPPVIRQVVVYGSRGDDDIAAQLQTEFVRRETERFGDKPIKASLPQQATVFETAA